MSSVAAVVVTFNRKVLLLECVDALLNQTKKVDRIFLIDNASSDGTQNLLKDKGYLDNKKIDYQLMSENLGGAGGFHEGIKSAYEAGYDWIWVMDDDAEPELSALLLLEKYFTQPKVIAVCPVVTDSNGVIEEDMPHRGWFIPFRKDRIARAVSSSEMKGKDILEIDHCSFVGLCFRADVINKIGLPKKEFFIHYDDSEFGSRLNTQGKTILVTGSVIRHKENAKNGLVDIKYVGGRDSQRIAYDRLWLLFYGYRNKTWLVAHKKIEGSWLSLFLMHIRKIIGIVIYDDHKLQRTKFWNSAFIDGIRGVFDNSKPLKILSPHKYISRK